MANKTRKIPNVIGPVYRRDVIKVEHDAKKTKVYLSLSALVYIDKYTNPYGGNINVYRPAYYHVDRDEFTILTGCGVDKAHTGVSPTKVFACRVRNVEHHETGEDGEDIDVYSPKFSHVLGKDNCEVIPNAEGIETSVDILGLIKELYGVSEE